jgi:hypothetical protein
MMLIMFKTEMYLPAAARAASTWPCRHERVENTSPSGDGLALAEEAIR